MYFISFLSPTILHLVHVDGEHYHSDCKLQYTHQDWL